MGWVVGFLTSPLGVCLCVLLVLILYLAYRYLYAPFQVHKRYGLTGPKPVPFFGNHSELNKLTLNIFLEEGHKKYGDVFCFYIGAQFNVAVYDWELIKEIMTTNNDKLHDRGMAAVLARLIKDPFGIPLGLVLKSGSEWLSSRIALSPAFTELRVKEIVPPASKSCTTLGEKFDRIARSQKSANLLNFYMNYTLESLTNIFFGHYVDVQNGKKSDLITAMEEYFEAAGVNGTNKMNDLALVFSHFPFMEPLLSRMVGRMAPAKKRIELHEAGLRMVKARRSQTAPAQDLLELVMATEFENEDGSRETASDRQVAAYVVDFLLSGVRAAAYLMSYVSYELALHPEIQDRVQEEIDQYFKKNPESSLYDASQDLAYLGSVFKETLRFHPPVAMLSRLVSRDIVMGGLTIPKGAGVHMATFLVHVNPRYWTEPEMFDPQRFRAEEKAKHSHLAYAPFGLGPHNCVGMRFVLAVTKMGLIAILRRHTFVRSPETVVPLQKMHGALDSPKNGLHLLIEPR